MAERGRGRRWSRIFKPDARSEVDEELAYHIESRVRDYMERGLDEQAARSAVEQRLGDLKSVRGECAGLLTAERRSEARRIWLNVSWLDFKLGFRMLLKYPGLTLVGGFAMAFAIWVGASTFALVDQLVNPQLPLQGGDRIVGIQLWDAQRGRPKRELAHDLESWREQARTIDDVGAFRTLERNLVTSDGRGEPVAVAEISASAFRVALERPALGRTLLPADESIGAPTVAVIGYEVWQDRFGADPGVVGQTVQLGREPATIVGVMPEGFAFPVAQSVWVPLRLNLLEIERGQGPSLRAFGRLAPGSTITEAQVELAALGQRAAADFPQTHEHLRPQVLSYPKSVINLGLKASFGLLSINLVLVMLLVLICGNVALLMFARAATRESEIVVRNALGASRARIVGQLFAEALVLGAFSALVGLAAAGYGLRWLLRAVQSSIPDGGLLPFWVTTDLSRATILYTVLLTILAAVIAGVIPALKVTRGLQTRLREAAVGASGLSFGGVWTAVIVAQVAVTLAFPVTAFLVRRDVQTIRAVDVGFPAEEFLSVRLEMDGSEITRGIMNELVNGAPLTAPVSPGDFRVQYGKAYQELKRRLLTDPAVAFVTFGERLPRMYHPHRLIQLDSGGAAPMNPVYAGYRVSSDKVDPEFFDAVRAPIAAGRGFNSGDLTSDQGVVIVNQSFVKNVLGGRNPIGRRIRYSHLEEWDEPRAADAAPEPWYQIVGVVRDLGMAYGEESKVAGFYHPATPELAYPMHIAVHLRGDAAEFGPRLRTLAAAVDPALRLYDLQPLDRVNQSDIEFLGFWFRLVLAVSAVALVLSLAGIYAVMSFAVSRRTREIGIRVALGAQQHRVIMATFSRPLAQVGAGVLAGSILVGALLLAVEGGELTLRGSLMLALYALFMMVVCLLASVVPTRRALRIQPTDALKAVE